MKAFLTKKRKKYHHPVQLIGKFLTTIILTLFINPFFGQIAIQWEDLEDVSFTYDYVEGLNTWYGSPTFGESVKRLDGQKVSLRGYIIPLDITGGNYMLSAYPYQMCFFCGGAGQESIVELRLRSKKSKFKMDDVMTFSGTLRLNDNDLEVSYILEDARPLK